MTTFTQTMTDLDKMARELLAAEYSKIGNTFRAEDIRKGRVNSDEHLAVNAIRTALMTAPPDYRLVPVEATDAMVEAAAEAYTPFGDMWLAIQSAMVAGDISK